jgi:hypothetical protein
VPNHTPPPVPQSLLQFFSNPANRSLEEAKRVLIRTIWAIEGQDYRRDLSAQSTILFGQASGLDVILGPPDADAASHRPQDYEPGDFVTPWLYNQYVLGICFRAALCRPADSTTGSINIPGPSVQLGAFAKELKGDFALALTRMTDPRHDRRFPDARTAVDFLEGLGKPSPFKVLLAAGVALFAVVVLVLGWLTFGGRHAPSAAAPVVVVAPTPSPKPIPDRPGMAMVSPGTVTIDGAVKPVAGFLMDQKAVSIERYMAYANANHKRLPFADSEEAQAYAREHSDHPVWNVSHQEASEFCAAEGKRLPFEAEWLRAVDSAGYPWGKGLPPAGSANVDSGALAPAGGTPADKTSGGIYDLIGNLPEWMQDDYAAERGQKVVRGGGYYLPAALSLHRLAFPAELSGEQEYLRVGFRCAAQ